MILQDQPDLFLVITLEKFRLRQRGAERAGGIDLAVRSFSGAVDIRGFDGKAEIGIIGRIGRAGPVSRLELGKPGFYFLDIFVI